MEESNLRNADTAVNFLRKNFHITEARIPTNAYGGIRFFTPPFVYAKPAKVLYATLSHILQGIWTKLSLVTWASQA